MRLVVPFDLSKLEEENILLESEMQEPDFWNNQERAQKVSQKLKQNTNRINEYKNLKQQVEDLEIFADMIIEENDESHLDELNETISDVSELLDNARIVALLSNEFDKNNAILSIHAGAGGTEAQDWADMLYRMYTRWIEAHGYNMTVLDILPDTEAGIKSVTLLVEGENAYGYLKSEKGVHRLVRISPFDAAKKRHTSFASIDVTPEIEDDVDIEINESDIRVDTYRSSGAGGQHVNTTDSAIRITHIPTGVVVSCQNQRSQHSNRETALKMLKSKLLEIKQLENKEKIEDIQGKYNQIAWGSQIRSYVFHPYSMVKDHRTNAETGNVQAVMDGSLDMFMNEYLKMKSLER
ncbi:peptide chain release factor 2 [Sedimentibacter hydroxybenzoicus DSM 7310]|uniref:Peptide chain release factor 2 n=1 Tax=Sedimentibacter hydroxybenzoicus DSM 7310 TaxID=1123245 RepID=A0A974GUX4_SEDHY|nr:peptide chain release factor 2 [Sedimentibacter hydroxybenzoicus DSM 7310]